MSNALGVPWGPEPQTYAPPPPLDVDAPAGRVLGWSLALDLGGCDPTVTGDPDALVAYVVELCERISMRRHGDPVVEHRRPRTTHFGVADLAGWTVQQLISTSTITVHAFDSDHCACVDVLSCAPYDARAVEEFTRQAFRAEAVQSTLLVRRNPAARGTLAP